MRYTRTDRRTTGSTAVLLSSSPRQPAAEGRHSYQAWRKLVGKNIAIPKGQAYMRKVAKWGSESHARRVQK